MEAEVVEVKKEPNLQELAAEIKTLQSEIHLLQRQQSSRRGPEGPRGVAGKDGRDGHDGKDGASIAKAEAIEVIRDLVLNDEAFRTTLGEVARTEIRKRWRF